MCVSNLPLYLLDTLELSSVLTPVCDQIPEEFPDGLTKTYMNSHNTLFALRNISTTELKMVIKSYLLCKQIFSAIDRIYRVHACFLVRVLPVLSLMYLAISSLRPERKRTFSVSFTVAKRWRHKEKHASLNNTGRLHETQTTNRKLMK